MIEEEEIPAPMLGAEMLTALDVSKGMPITALTRLGTMDSGTWEDFTLELVSCLRPSYKKVVRCGGGGDMGRDVIGYMSDCWENYQCKYYDKKLSVAEAVLEVGKIIYYSYIGEYELPRKYYFVSPKGNGTNLIKVLSDPSGEKMKSELIVRWDKVCKDEITKKQAIELDDDLLKYIEDVVDFTIFDDIPPIRLIELHSDTPYHAIRFGNYFKKRPTPPKAPEDIDWSNEQKYVQALLEAFSQYKSTDIDTATLSKFPAFSRELSSARNNFFSADALDKFSRDWLPPGSFSELKEECYEAVSATIIMNQPDGYTRYLKASELSVQVTYDSHPLNHYIKMQDKKGLPHHIVNDGVFKWINNDEE